MINTKFQSIEFPFCIDIRRQNPDVISSVIKYLEYKGCAYLPNGDEFFQGDDQKHNFIFVENFRIGCVRDIKIKYRWIYIDVTNGCAVYSVFYFSQIFDIIINN